MVGLSTRTFDRGLPEPPYSVDLLAAFHAGALDAVTADHVRRRLPTDPRSADVLTALDRVRNDLRNAGRHVPAMPDDVAARLDSLIDRLTAE